MFGDNLKAARLEKGYTLEQLATLYNQMYSGSLSKGTLSKYENGKQEPMISVVANLATILNVSIDYMLGKEQPSKPAEERNKDSNSNRVRIMRMLDQLSDDRRKVIENLIALEWKQQQRK